MVKAYLDKVGEYKGAKGVKGVYMKEGSILLYSSQGNQIKPKHPVFYAKAVRAVSAIVKRTQPKKKAGGGSKRKMCMKRKYTGPFSKVKGKKYLMRNSDGTRSLLTVYECPLGTGKFVKRRNKSGKLVRRKIPKSCSLITVKKRKKKKKKSA